MPDARRLQRFIVSLCDAARNAIANGLAVSHLLTNNCDASARPISD